MNGKQQVGPYDLTALLRSGGGGSVYYARERRTGQLVALKTAHPSRPQAAAGLRREIATLLALQDAGVPGVVKVVDNGEDGGQAWFAMELIDGPNLGEFQRELWSSPALGTSPVTSPTAATVLASHLANAADPSIPGLQSPFPAVASVGVQPTSDAQALRRALGIAKRISETLCRVHELGLLHGDLSPSNILLRSNDEPVLLDFGTSYAVFERTQFREPSLQGFERYGTPGYIAPELLLGESIDLRCDVYSLGCVLHELLYAFRPFTGARPEDLLQQHLRVAPRLPQRPGVPAQLGELLVRMLAKSPERRISDVQTVVSALNEALGESQTRAATAPRTTLLRPRFVGRENVKLELLGCLTQAHNGLGQAVLLAAPSGAGKTRLLNEVGTAAARNGCTVISCQASPSVSVGEFATSSSGFSLLAPVLQYARALAHSTQTDGDKTMDRLRTLLGALEAYLPSERAHTTEPGAPKPATHVAAEDDKASRERARQRSFDAFQDLLKLLAERQPLLLLLDDVQWADELSLAFFAARAKHLASVCLLCVPSIRSDASPQRAESIAAWAQRRLELPALDGQSSAALVKDLLGTETLPEGLLDYIEVSSEGNPFFIGEHLRSVLSAGLLHQLANGEWSFPTPSELRRRTLDVPRGVDDSIARRLTGLSPAARQVLSQAAVLGREFDEQLLTLQFEGASLATTIALQELVAHQFLVQLAAARYRFAHDRLREAAERALPVELRRQLHRNAALALEATDEPVSTSKLARLANHWAAAAAPAQALSYFETAAGCALEENDVDFACELFRSAVSQATELASDTTPERCITLNEALGDALVLRARHSEGRQCFAAAFEHTPPADRLRRARLKRKQATTHWTLHEYPAAERLLCEAELALTADALEQAPAMWQEHIQIQIGRFEYLYFSQRSGAEIDTLIQQLEQPIAAWGTPRQRNVYYVAASNHALMRSRYAYREDAIMLAANAVHASAGLEAQQRALAHLAYGFALEKGNPEQRLKALAEMEAAMLLAQQAQAATLQARIATYHLLVLRRLGDTASTANFLPLASGTAEAARLPPYVAAANAAAGWVAWRAGSREAGALLQKARSVWLAHPHPYPFRWLATFPLLDIALATGELDEIQTLVRELLDPVQQAFPAELAEQLKAIDEKCTLSSAHAARSEIDRALRTASELGYC